MSLLRLVSVLLVLGACGGDDDDDGSDGDGASADAAGSDSDGASADAPESGFAVDIVEWSCGPADGPAFTLKLGGAYDPETCTIDFDTRNLTISIFLDELAVEAPVTFSFGGEELRGSGQMCPGGEGACLTATAGTVHVQTWTEDEGASGTFELTMDGGDPIAGGFDAVWCTPEGGGPYCG